MNPQAALEATCNALESLAVMKNGRTGAHAA
jgi:hypothetical protein